MLLGTPPERKSLLKYLTGREKNERTGNNAKGGWGKGTFVSCEHRTGRRKTAA